MYAGSDIEKALTEAQQKNKLSRISLLLAMKMARKHRLDVHIEDECGLEE